MKTESPLSCHQRARPGLVVALFAALAASDGAAQSSCVQRLTGSLQPYTSFGFAAALIGDVDNDGVGDVAIGDPQPGLNSSGIRYNGEVRVFSGRTLGLLYSVAGPQLGCRFGAAVAGLADRNGDGRPDAGWGDVDGDAVPDFVVGAPDFDAAVGGRVRNGAGLVMLLSGRTGVLICGITGTTAQEEFGYAVSSAGSYGGAAPGFVVGAPGASGSTGTVTVCDGLCNVVATRNGSASNDRFGAAVALVGDADNDGRADLLIGSPGRAAGLGRIEVFASLASPPLLQINGVVPNGSLGDTVAAAGDLNADGAFDFLAGNQRDSVYAYRHDGVLLHEVRPGFRNPSRAGHDLGGLTGIGDFDGDGRGDFAFGARQAGAYNTETGVVTIVSGATGRILRELMDPDTRKFGAAIVAPTAGGAATLMIGSPATRAGSGSAATGQVHHVALVGASSTVIGSGCSATAGIEPNVRLGGLPPCIGEPEFGLTFAGKPACAQCPAVVHMGIAGTDFLVPGAGTCRLYTLPLVVLPFGGGGSSEEFRRLPIPADPSLQGGVIHVQGVAVDPAAPWPLQVVTSSALRFTIR